MLAVKYPNVYLDTAILYSGTPGDALRQVLAEQVGLDVIERSLFNKIVFGINYPRVDMRRFVRGVRALELSTATEQAIFTENASRLLKMEGVEMKSIIHRIEIQTVHETEMINITPQVQRDGEQQSASKMGRYLFSVLHTTTAITVNEGLLDLEKDITDMIHDTGSGRSYLPSCALPAL